MTDAESFVQQFVTTWGDPTRFADIYEPEAIITSPVVRRRVVAGELAEFVDRTKALLPDARLHVERWAAGGDFVLIEWRIGATLAGEPLERKTCPPKASACPKPLSGDISVMW